VAVASAAVRESAASLKDIKHLVLFMQENRSFNHVSCVPLVSPLSHC